MKTITMGSDEFILYIRKQYPKCETTTFDLGGKIADWMTDKGFYDSTAKKGRPKCKNERDCLWDTSDGAKNIKEEKLPKTANQYVFDRALLPELYDFLDKLGEK